MAKTGENNKNAADGTWLKGPKTIKMQPPEHEANGRKQQKYSRLNVGKTTKDNKDASAQTWPIGHKLNMALTIFIILGCFGHVHAAAFLLVLAIFAMSRRLHFH